jgi:lipopolysaccharide assembly protein A
MGQVGLVLSLLLATGVALFAVQNAAPVALRFGFWGIETSLVVVILVATVVGAVLASLVGLPGWIQDRRRLRQQDRELEALRPKQPPTASPPPAAPPAERPSGSKLQD